MAAFTNLYIKSETCFLLPLIFCVLFCFPFNREQKIAEREKRSIEQQRKKMEKEAQRMIKKEQKIAVKLS